MSISVGKKLILGFGVVVLISFIGGMFSFVGILTLNSDIQQLVGVSVDRMSCLDTAEIAYATVKFSVERWKNPLLARDVYAEQFDVLSELMSTIGANLDKYGEYAKADSNAARIAKFNELMACRKDHVERLQKIIELAHKVQGKPDASEQIGELYIALDINGSRAKFETAFSAIRDDLNKISTDVVKSSKATADRTSIISLMAVLVTLVVGMLIGITLERSIVKVVAKISQSLMTNSSNITTSSKELAAGSESLAAGSSEQAASVEQISATLTEVSSMVKQNADNAAQAGKLVTQTGATMDATQQAFQRSLAANEEISKASSETSKIIKTIDEIAFQTNLLSLNAAVEAARAGEAGAGFAVVAGEVRGLAMRSAEASKRTAELIAQTIDKVKEGTEIFAETGKNFNMVVEQSQKIQQLVSEVAAASNEQAKGIEQINTGVVEMEKVIQQNAANSEESAAATQELATQAEAMLRHVRELGDYVLGSNTQLISSPPAKSGASAAPAPKEPEKKAPAHVPKLLAKKESAPAHVPKPPEKKAPAPAAKPAKHEEPMKAEAHHPPAPAAAAHPKKGPTAAEQVIPLDESDMADF